jgi:hypothetical protein
MKRYIYLSLIPEALIASMLPPVEFGNYLAVGTKKRTRGNAIFFEIDQEKVRDLLPWDHIEERCVPHEDGKPKNSLYLSIYRVLEMIPLDAFLSLYLTTDDGRTLELKPGEYPDEEEKQLHLYQELTPVTPRVVSSLPPKIFLKRMTGDNQKIAVPKLVFTELKLEGLAHDPLNAPVGDLPYQNIGHLRNCLMTLKGETGKTKKTVIRYLTRDLIFRTIKNGFFVGDKNKVIYYPLPSVEVLEKEHYAWWRSAKLVGF